MQFYKIGMYIDMNVEKEDLDSIRRYSDRDHGRTIAEKCNKANEKLAGKGFFFINRFLDGECSFGMIIRERIDVDKFVNRFITENKLKAEGLKLRETTLQHLKSLLNEADRCSYIIYDEDEILLEFGLENIAEERGFRGVGGYIREKIIIDRERDSIYRAADSYFTKDTFLQELDRIYWGSARKGIIGHPVDYIIESDDERTLKGMSVLLLQALYSVGRIENRRYSVVNLSPDMRFSKKTIDELYRVGIGGTVILNMVEMDDEDEDLARGEYYFLDDLGDVIRRYCSNVLTVICMPRECKNIKMKLYETVGNCSFVEIRENQSADEMAVEYLKKRAKEYKVRSDKKLISSLEKGKGYLAPELNEIFNQWYGEKLKTNIYKQYKDICKAKSEIKDSKPKGNVYDELMGMIGLGSAKEMITRSLDSYKARKLFKDKGMAVDSLCNHMIFTGNPGTAKTTVARLFAGILKDNDVLSKGHIVEVGRGDLVGKFVGWTAPTIKKKFQQAMGGVLFIDEAYSLVDDRDGSFGDEAINTIVQEMENHRNDVIVIFAGYPDKMEGFLDKNPGLRSRIAHYIQFEDYNTDELCLIAEHIAKKMGLVLDPGAKEKIREVMYKASQQPDFGNGRYARNVIEKARMVQSSRLVRMDYDSVTPVDVKTILAEDIEMPKEKTGVKRMKIGFSA